MGKLRVEFVTVDDPLYILPFFDEFFRHYREQVDIRHVSLCRTMGKRPRKQLAAELIALYGAAGFARIATRAASSKILGIVPKRADAVTYHSMRQLCRAYRIPAAHIESPSSPQFIAALRSRKSDVLISVACPYILKKDVLSIPPMGCLNIHHAPLPKYRGMMPTFWQLYHGEKAVGLTVHAMTESLDEGAILYQTQVEVLHGESLHQLMCRCKRHGAHCMAAVLQSLRAGDIAPVKLQDTTSSYFTFPTLAEIREFHKRGLRAI